MALDFTNFKAALQAKLNATSDPKEMLLLGKAIEATIGNQAISDIQAEGATQIGLVQSAGAGYAKPNTAQTWTAQQTFRELKETVHELTSTVIDPANGTIQHKALATATTLTEALESGQSVLLRITGGDTHVVTWPPLTWVGGSAPTLTAADLVVVWKDAAGGFAAYIGSVAG